MDVLFDMNGVRFAWDSAKAQRNAIVHGVTFERATTAFFDPFLRVVDAGRNDESRDAIVGYDGAGQMLFVVHIEVVHPKSDEEVIRIISARKATLKEREHYDT